MNKYTLLIISIFTVMNFIVNASQDTRQSNIKVINDCISKIEEFTQKPLSSEVDHIYLHVFKNLYEIYLLHGAVGTFGERSLDTKTIMSCLIQINNDGSTEITHLSAPLKTPIIDKSPEPIHVKDMDIIEILYIKVNDSYEYCCEQSWDEENIYKNNPDFHWGDSVQ